MPPGGGIRHVHGLARSHGSRAGAIVEVDRERTGPDRLVRVDVGGIEHERHARAAERAGHERRGDERARGDERRRLGVRDLPALGDDRTVRERAGPDAVERAVDQRQRDDARTLRRPGAVDDGFEVRRRGRRSVRASSRWR